MASPPLAFFSVLHPQCCARIPSVIDRTVSPISGCRLSRRVVQLRLRNPSSIPCSLTLLTVRASAAYPPNSVDPLFTRASPPPWR